MSSADGHLGLYLYIWDEIVTKGRLEMFEEHFDPGCSFITPSMTLAGRDSIRAYFAELLGAFSEPEFVVEEAFEGEGRLVKRWEFRGAHTGMFSGIPATGNRVVYRGVTIARMEGGKIVEERDFADDLGLMQQLGALPPL
jgi:steroid delta-isomerase-like uncharacterized protein